MTNGDPFDAFDVMVFALMWFALAGLAEVVRKTPLRKRETVMTWSAFVRGRALLLGGVSCGVALLVLLGGLLY